MFWAETHWHLFLRERLKPVVCPKTPCWLQSLALMVVAVLVYASHEFYPHTMMMVYFGELYLMMMKSDVYALIQWNCYLNCCYGWTNPMISFVSFCAGSYATMAIVNHASFVAYFCTSMMICSDLSMNLMNRIGADILMIFVRMNDVGFFYLNILNETMIGDAMTFSEITNEIWICPFSNNNQMSNTKKETTSKRFKM